MAGNPFLQNPENIATGWAPEPQLHAPEIGGLVGHILQNRILQRAQQDKEIADAIKQYQQQQASGAYLDAARQANLIDPSAMEGLSSPAAGQYGKTLADQLRERQEQQSRSSYEDAIRQRILDKNDPSNDPNAADMQAHPVGSTWYEPDGSHWYMTAKGRRMYPTSMQDTSARPQSERQTFQTEKDLENAIAMHQLRSQIEAQQNTTANKPNVPYSGSTDWAAKQNELDRLRQQRQNPPPDDQIGGGNSSSYATPSQIKLARARQALQDPQATDDEKRQAQIIIDSITNNGTP